MKTFSQWQEKTKTFKTITITCRDNEDSLENLLQHIQKTGNVGHSFSILVDPKGDHPEKFDWDGDGSDCIKDIQVS
jgi:hypothetical protein